MIKTDQRLIVALDMPALDPMKNLVTNLGETVGFYKVGMELYYSIGNEAIRFLRDRGKRVFLDLKLHDIPNTVARSAAVLTGLGTSIINVHAAGGPAMLRAAASSVADTAAGLGINRPKLIAVTVLTSIGASEWQALGYNTNLTGQVVRLAVMAQQSGADGVVASPREAAQIRRECGPDFLIVAPGIRPAAAAADDQIRTTTPAGALQAGADYLVIGRPITAAPDPVAAATMIIDEMEAVQVDGKRS